MSVNRHSSAERRRSGPEWLGFLRAFLRAPSTVGAVLPSSAHLARMMLAGHDLQRARVVVELGPGTGAFTRFIEQAAHPEAVILALEVDASAVAWLRERHPRVQIEHDSAERIRAQLRSRGLDQADAILSGIPWAAMPAALQERIMGEVRAAMAPSAWFSTFTYLHSPRTARGAAYAALLARSFARVERSPMVWRNFPPAFVYRCATSA